MTEYDLVQANSIDVLYIEVLGRHVEPAGLATWQTFLADPEASLITVRAALADSAEAAATISSLYQQILGRNADPIGLANFQHKIAQPDMNLANVRADLANAPEAATAIKGLYQSVFGRAASPDELGAMQQALAQPGMSLDSIQVILANSREASGISRQIREIRDTATRIGRQVELLQEQLTTFMIDRTFFESSVRTELMAITNIVGFYRELVEERLPPLDGTKSPCCIGSSTGQPS